MPFTINVPQGTREGALKAIAAAKSLPENADQSQIEAVKELLAKRVNALDKKWNGVRVTASGDQHPGAETITINIIPLQVHL